MNYSNATKGGCGYAVEGKREGDFFSMPGGIIFKGENKFASANKKKCRAIPQG